MQQAQHTMDQRQGVFEELQAKLNAQNAGRQPLAVAALPPVTQSRVSITLLRTPCLSPVPSFQGALIIVSTARCLSSSPTAPAVCMVCGVAHNSVMTGA